MRNTDRPKKSDIRVNAGEKKQSSTPKPVFKKRENGVGGFGERKRTSETKSFEDKKTYGDRKPYGDKKPFGDRKPFEDKKPYGDKKPFGDRKPFEDKKPYGDKKPFGDRKPFEDKKPYGDKKPFGDRKPFEDKKPYGDKKPFGDRKPFGDKKPFEDKKPYGDTKPFGEKPKSYTDEKPAHPFKKRDESGRATSNDRKNAYSADKPRFQRNEPASPRAKFESKENQATIGRKDAPTYDVERMKSKLPEKIQKKVLKEDKIASKDDSVRLNRYISNAGVASRRDADQLIASGEITVNGKSITEMGYQVKPNDVVKYGKKILSREKLVYLLLNKPKDFITTTEDPDERRTVMDLVKNACPERIYPVGRLDRNTTGLLLLTNDGELAEKLSHPSHEIKKIYQVELDKPISVEDFETIANGFDLEDGFVKPDEIALVTPDAEVVGIKIHSGKNRIVRRIFEHLGYEVLKLDRTTYAGLDKKDLPRGKWRFLTEKEVIRLKYMI